MPIHIEEMTSEVVALDGDFPLTEAQVEKLIKLVLKRLEDKERNGKQTRQTTAIRRSMIPTTGIER